MYDILPDHAPAPGFGLKLSTPHNYVAHELSDLDTMILAVERAIAERRFGLDAIVSELDRQEPPELDLERPVETNYGAWVDALKEDGEERSETADFYTALQTLRTLWRHGYEVDRHWPPGPSIHPGVIISVDPLAERVAADPWARAETAGEKQAGYILYDGSAAAKLVYGDAFGVGTLPEMTSRWFVGLFVRDAAALPAFDINDLSASIVTGAREQARFARSTRYPTLPARLEASTIAPGERVALFLPDLCATDIGGFDHLIDVFAGNFGDTVGAFLDLFGDRVDATLNASHRRTALGESLGAAVRSISLIGWPHDGFRPIDVSAEELHYQLGLRVHHVPCEIVLVGVGRGGLVARAFLQRLYETGDAAMAERIKGVITLGAPHEGGAIAKGDLGATAAPFISAAATANSGWSAVQAITYAMIDGKRVADHTLEATLAGVGDLRASKDAPGGFLATLGDREADRAAPPTSPIAAIGGEASGLEPEIFWRRAGPAAAIQTARHIEEQRRIGPVGKLLPTIAAPLRRDRRRGVLARAAQMILRPLALWCWRGAQRRGRQSIGRDRRHDLFFGLPSTTWRSRPKGWAIETATVDRQHFGYVAPGSDVMVDAGDDAKRLNLQAFVAFRALDFFGLVPEIAAHALATADRAPQPATEELAEPSVGVATPQEPRTQEPTAQDLLAQELTTQEPLAQEAPEEPTAAEPDPQPDAPVSLEQYAIERKRRSIAS